MFSCACRFVLLPKNYHINDVHKVLSVGYKSKLSLENLYPDGREMTKHDKLSAPVQADSDKEAFSGIIPLEDLRIQYCRSSGPGGQHVNKVNTKVEVRFKIDEALWIPDWIKPKLKEQQPNRINKDGELIVTSEKTRKQILNQADCLDKLRKMIFQASVLPKELTPEQKALIKKREEEANKRRLEEKRRRSLLLQRRASAP